MQCGQEGLVDMAWVTTVSCDAMDKANIFYLTTQLSSHVDLLTPMFVCVDITTV